MPPVSLQILHRDPATRARLGVVHTPHGSFMTPAFMPVGTQGAMKGILPSQLAATGAEMMLSNTYHLMLRPGSDLVASMGGLQHWTRWERPMLTDSGGFQVFSLAHMSRITERGVAFKSHLDGANIELTPELSMKIQNELGADIIMAFDECPPGREGESRISNGGIEGLNLKSEFPNLKSEISTFKSEISNTESKNSDGESRDAAAAHNRRVVDATHRSARWLERCVAAHRDHGRPGAQALFGIVQGGTDPELRAWSVEQTVKHDLPGYAIGGVAVGESPGDVHRIITHTAPLLPDDRPRYLMGVGYERDIVAAVRSGVDMFDCVLPTRNGRNANVFTRTGQVRLKNLKHREDPAPIDEGCDCPACAGGFTRGYLRHLFQAREMLGPILASLHNLHHFQRLMLDIRHAIRHNAWLDFAHRWPVAELSS